MATFLCVRTRDSGSSDEMEKQNGPQCESARSSRHRWRRRHGRRHGRRHPVHAARARCVYGGRVNGRVDGNGGDGGGGSDGELACARASAARRVGTSLQQC